MTVRCAGCGEEIMGAVNRCWRCGRTFVPQAGVEVVPPVRRSPIAHALVVSNRDAAEQVRAERSAQAEDLPIVARLSGGNGEDADPVSPETVSPETVSPETVSPETGAGREAETGNGNLPGAIGAASRRRGSPFAEGVSSRTVKTARAQADGSAVRPVYPRNAAAVGGAIGSIVLGLMSLMACFFTNAAIVTGLLGLGMGVWGLYSTRRGLAATGVIVCLIALAISSFNGAVDWYTYVNGGSPFQTTPLYEDDSPEETGLPNEL